MNRRKELLKKHPYKIWQGTDGYWNTYLPDRKRGRIRKKKRTQRDIEDLVIEYYKAEEENPTLEEVFLEWINRRVELGKIQDSTRERNIYLFKKHYSDFGKNKIKDIDPEHITDFLEEQIFQHNLTSKAFANLKGITRGFLLRAKKRGLVNFNVTELLDDMDISDRDFKKVIKEDYEEVFNEYETELVMKYLINNLDPKNIGILLIFLTGIRVGELVALKHTDFDDFSFKIRRTEVRKKIDGRYQYLIKDYPKTPSGVREEIIPKDYWWLCKQIENLNKGGEFIFMSDYGGTIHRMTTNSFRRRLEKICDELGIYRKSPHKIRKTYISILLDNNIDHNMITTLAGHTDINCSEKHYHRNRKNIDRKVEILSNIPDFQYREKAT